ncbi:VCBS domain-containing protein [Vibrio lentus]
MTATDVDNADNTFTATSIEGTNGTFSIAENGGVDVRGEQCVQ